ncbi:MAG TPA: carboxypeptidase-like regulatory domain-containing protein [Pyrinomonadaceae bacterium]|nr:carboxypeptidase-like regulatory domain-containing protein [Pyrinomonadaceae bacterium]
MPLVPHARQSARRLPLFLLALASLFICLHSAQAQTAAPTPTPLVTQLSMSGEEGDYISGGQDYLFKPVDSTFAPEVLDYTGDGAVDSVRFTVTQGDKHWFILEFGTGSLNRNLVPGYYGNAWVYGPANPFLNIFGDHKGCGNNTGSFNIHELKVDYSGANPRLVNFAASFEQHCEGVPEDLLGTLYYRYTGSQSTKSISGRVTDSLGNPVANAKVALSGSKAATATTDAGGNYTFAKLLSGGNYRVIPTPSAARVYSPVRRKILRLSGDIKADFKAVGVYRIAGRVTNSSGTPLAGLPVTLGGSKTDTVVTDSKGNYSFPNLRGDGNYTVAVGSQQYRFAPTSHTFQGLPSNQILNFTGTPREYTLGGQVLDINGTPMVGLTVKLDGERTGATLTDGNGRYQFRNLKAGANYTITAVKPYYVFFPPSQIYHNLSGSWGSANFTAVPNVHILSGVVLDSNANALPGVLVTLSGSQSEIAITDHFGRFRFTNVPAGGNYTVTPSLEGRTFTPASRSFKLLTESVGIVNFIAAP